MPWLPPPPKNVLMSLGILSYDINRAQNCAEMGVDQFRELLRMLLPAVGIIGVKRVVMMSVA